MPKTAKVVADFMQALNARFLFGLPGGQGGVDLIAAAADNGIEYVLVKQESAASIMAAAQGELTGLPGFCQSAVAPGLTNMINGIAYAFLDRAPLIAIADQYSSGRLDVIYRQQMYHRPMLDPITKWHATLSAAGVDQMLRRALRTTISGRPGPVFFDLPSDAAIAEAPESSWTPDRLGPITEGGSSAFTVGPVRALADRIGKARLPVVIAGMGVNWDRAYGALRAFAEHGQFPVFTTPKAKGALPEDHPLAAGVFMQGKLELEILDRADLIVAVGLDPVELLAKPWKMTTPIVYVDRVPNLDQFFEAEVEVVGDIGAILEAIVDLMPKTERWDAADVQAYRRVVTERLNVATRGLGPHQVLAAARRALPREAVVMADSGASKLLALQLWQALEPQTFFLSQGLATMGYSVPAALAAQLLDRDRYVLSLCGDGGFLMRVQELETAARYNLPVTFVVFSDFALNQIKVKQQMRGFQPVGTEYPEIDFSTIAKGFGIQGVMVSTEAELDAALATAVQSRVATVIDARIDASSYPVQFDVIREL